jgi:glyoxylase-like metal-dependent hydrolase (beta-lactamase superfamily II)
MKKQTIPLFLFVLLFWVSAAQAQIPDLKNVKIITTHVAGNVYMLEATGDVAGNIGVSAGPDGILLIDTQFAPLADRIRAALKTINKGKVRYIVNTHHHEDHAHGNRTLGHSAILIGHQNTQGRLKETSPENQPDLSFENQMSLFFNGEEIRLIYFPSGHTDNDVVVYFTKSNVFHLGDLWNSGTRSFPTVDIDAGGSVLGMLKNVEALIQIIPPDAKIIPGHYSLSDLNDLKRTQTMLVDTISHVQNQMNAGKTLDQILQDGLPHEYETWGTAYTSEEQWIKNLYIDLKQEHTFPKKNRP